ncbi:MAG: ABC transporter ATP-binding protein [Candidatus Eiseniibacteriota bacterium]
MTPPPILSVREIRKTFGDLRAVDGVSFELSPGEILGFLGPNGAGKTTTLRMILEITRPDGGAVIWDGGATLDRRRIGYLPEERGLFEDATVAGMLAYLGMLRGMETRAANEPAMSWLERLGLADRARGKVGTLSKGNQQKVQFAGAILHRPALAVLDEPFSGLDPINQELVITLIRGLRDQGTAVLLSAHQLDLAERLCDRFHLIARGRAVLQGTLESIRREVARGAGEVLQVDLRADASRGDGSPDELVRAVMPGAECRLERGRDPALRLEASLPEASDLSPILGALSARYAIERVQMRPLSLHEIYLRAVPAAAAAEEAVHG